MAFLEIEVKNFTSTEYESGVYINMNHILTVSKEDKENHMIPADSKYSLQIALVGESQKISFETDDKQKRDDAYNELIGYLARGVNASFEM